jgi:hypothetical protein
MTRARQPRRALVSCLGGALLAALAAGPAAVAAQAPVPAGSTTPGNPPGPVVASTLLSALPGAAQSLTAYQGWVVWSARDATGAWYLTALHDGEVARLPAAPRSTPFDADAGPDSQGRPTLVFSRCTRAPTSTKTAPVPDWATAGGCRIHELTLGHGREHRLAGLPAGGPRDSDYAPSIWRGQISFARLPAGAHTARILLSGPRGRLRRLAGGTPPCVHTVSGCSPRQGHAGALAMDLGPHVLALSWLIRATNVTGIADGTELLSVPLDGHANALADSGFFSGTCGYLTPNSPNATGAGVAYLLDSGGDDCAQDAASFELFSPPGARQAAPAVADLLPVAEARDGAVTYWIGENKPHADSYYGYSDCVTAPGACSLMRSDAIPFAPIPNRRPHPPTY